jgi:hypothetical protein
VLHLPVEPGSGPRVVTIESNGVWAVLGRSASGDPAYGCVQFPLVLSRAFHDGRVFENLAALPRFYAGWETASRTREEFVADLSIEPSAVTTFHGPLPIDVARLGDVPDDRRDVTIEIGQQEAGIHRIIVVAPAPFLLVSSEKVTPELDVQVDGEETRIFTVNSMFAAVLVGEGSHEVAFERRIGRGWWPWSWAGVILFVAGGFADRPRRVARP